MDLCFLNADDFDCRLLDSGIAPQHHWLVIDDWLESGEMLKKSIDDPIVGYTISRKTPYGPRTIGRQSPVVACNTAMLYVHKQDRDVRADTLKCEQYS